MCVNKLFLFIITAIVMFVGYINEKKSRIFRYLTTTTTRITIKCPKRIKGTRPSPIPRAMLCSDLLDDHFIIPCWAQNWIQVQALSAMQVRWQTLTWFNRFVAKVMEQLYLTIVSIGSTKVVTKHNSLLVARTVLWNEIVVSTILALKSHVHRNWRHRDLVELKN